MSNFILLPNWKLKNKSIIIIIIIIIIILARKSNGLVPHGKPYLLSNFAF